MDYAYADTANKELRTEVSDVGDDFLIRHAIEIISDQYGDTVSVNSKKKDLIKFGTHTSVGTGWETLAEMQDSETEETFVTGNDITHVISTVNDTGDVTIQRRI